MKFIAFAILDKQVDKTIQDMQLVIVTFYSKFSSVKF